MEEILHQLIGGLSHYLQGFNHPRWWRISSIHSIYLYQRVSIEYCARTPLDKGCDVGI